MANRWDLIVVGGGAAGLLAATRAAELGQRVLLLEKNRKPGVKILMSGGTRCNLTHAASRSDIVAAFGRQGRFLHSALAALSPEDVVALFHNEGVATKVEETGKVFPVSDRATDVLAALAGRLRRSGAELALAHPVIGCEPRNGGFEVSTPDGLQSATRLLITTGGMSYPGCGTTGDGYAWAQATGHRIVVLRPALVPLATSAGWVKDLPGVTIRDVAVQLRHAGGKLLDQRRGSFLFTHFGISGPVVLDVSGTATAVGFDGVELRCDFLPETPRDALHQHLQTAALNAGKRRVVGPLSELLPRRLVEALMYQSDVPFERRAAGLTRAERTAIVSAIKGISIPLLRSQGFKKAEVTAGGVDLADVDSRTMQSKRMPGLYFAGEVLDLDGPIGGYNFQSAFSTAWLAAESM